MVVVVVVVVVVVGIDGCTLGTGSGIGSRLAGGYRTALATDFTPYIGISIVT